MKKVMSFDEWQKRGENLYGVDPLSWKVCCPACGNIQSPQDFKQYKEQGATPNSCFKECIGRYLPKEKRGGFSKDHSNPNVKSPCDYAGWGLFRLSPLEIEFPDGSRTDCFAFAGDEVNK